MRLPAVPPSTQKPTSPDDYPGTLISWDEVVEKDYGEGQPKLVWKTVWRLDDFTDDIWIWVNVSSRHPKGTLFKLHVAMENRPPPPDDIDIDVDPWRNRRAYVTYNYGTNPRDKTALGVEGFKRMKDQAAPVATNGHAAVAPKAAAPKAAPPPAPPEPEYEEDPFLDELPEDAPF